MKLNLVTDMKGCPNRCLHCWLGHMPNKNLVEGCDDEYIVNYFKPYFETIEFYSWLREPDYNTDYRKRRERDISLSINSKPRRFELASFYTLVRNPDYVDFLKETETEVVQLTLFGLEEMTDKYVGRKGAFKEILQSTDILLRNNIAVRWQAFVNKENKDEIVDLLTLVDELKLKERCHSIGKEFNFFVFSGSCDGENMNLYDIRIDKDEIPKKLIPYYNDYDSLFTEKELCEILKDDKTHIKFDKTNTITVNISNNFDAYLNYTHMTNPWKIGNIKTENSEDIVSKILNNNVPAIKTAENVTIGELVEKCGDFSSNKGFKRSDYKMYLLNKYLQIQE